MYLIIFLLLALPIALVIFFAYAPQIGSKPAGERLRKITASAHFKRGVFQNVIDTSLDMSVSKMVRTLYKMIFGAKDGVPLKAIDTVRFDREAFEQLGRGDEAAICWFGHSTLLLRIHGKTFLTDPVIVGQRASMLSFVGPRQFVYSNPIRIGQLPPIDAIILSHDHYDHLDYKTIITLKEKVAQFIVPLGVGAHLEQWGVAPIMIREFDWWQQYNYNADITFHCTPSRHFSGRALTGRNVTLWCSWVIISRQQRLYFGADSGYSPSFREVGQRFGPFDFCMLECGAYSEFWPVIHMMPEQTVQAAIDLNARMVLPIHWAKFNLSLHPWREPVQRFTKEATERGLRHVTPQIGQIFLAGEQLARNDWWQADA